jgi:hypothetical protein
MIARGLWGVVRQLGAQLVGMSACGSGAVALPTPNRATCGL